MAGNSDSITVMAGNLNAKTKMAVNSITLTAGNSNSITVMAGNLNAKTTMSVNSNSITLTAGNSNADAGSLDLPWNN